MDINRPISGQLFYYHAPWGEIIIAVPLIYWGKAGFLIQTDTRFSVAKGLEEGYTAVMVTILGFGAVLTTRRRWR